MKVLLRNDNNALKNGNNCSNAKITFYSETSSCENSNLKLNVFLMSKQALYGECDYAKCRYAECHYAECRGAVYYT